MDPDLERALKGAKGRTIQSALFNIAHAYERAGRLAWKALTESADADFAGPGIMCQSFAIELLLKFFIASDHPHAKTFQALTQAGANLRGHGYLELWDRVASGRQAEVAASYSLLTNKSVAPHEFRSVLEALGGDPFVKWRYIYEANGLQSIDPQLLNRASDALGKTAEAVRRKQVA